MTGPFPMIPLGDLLTKSEKWIALKPDESYREVTVRLWGKGVVQRRQVTGAEIATRKRLVVQSQQFILSRIDARNGAFGLIPDSLDGAIVSNDFPVFTPNRSRLLPSFLHWMSRTRAFVALCRVASEGTTNRVRLVEDRFLATEIPLPPLEEQRRIVARIEELATKIEEARGLRRQAVEQAEAVCSSSAVRLFSAQSNVDRIPIDELTEVRGGIQKGPHRAPGGNPVRYLTVAHVHRNRISLSDPRFFEVSPAELDRWRLHSGDVLIIEGNGSADQIGRSALFRGEIENCVHQNHVIRIRPEQRRVDPQFLNAYLNSPPGQDEVHAHSRTTSGLRNLSVGRIKQVRVPVPALQEQHRIVAYLANLQTRVDALKRLQTETTAELDALLPSILDKAFRGEL